MNQEDALLLNLKNRKEEALHQKGIPLSREEAHHQKDIPLKKGEDHHRRGIPLSREEDLHHEDILPKKGEDHHRKDTPQREEAPHQGDIPLKGKQVEEELRVVEDLHMKEEIPPAEETVKRGIKIPGGLHHQSMVAEDLEEEVQEEDHLMPGTTLIGTVLGGLLVGTNIVQDPILVEKKHHTVGGGPLTQGAAREGHYQGHNHIRIFTEDQLLIPLANTVDMDRRSASPRGSQGQRALRQKT